MTIVLTLASVAILVAYHLGRRRHGTPTRRPGYGHPYIPPLVRLEWANEIPVAVVEEGHAAAVTVWMEAARSGTVIHA